MTAPEGRRRRQLQKNKLDTSSWLPEERAAYENTQRMNTPLAELELSVRAVNSLEEHNIVYCRDLYRLSYEAMLKIPNFGEKTLKEVCKALKLHGLTPPAWKPAPKPKASTKAWRNDAGLSFW